MHCKTYLPSLSLRATTRKRRILMGQLRPAVAMSAPSNGGLETRSTEALHDHRLDTRDRRVAEGFHPCEEFV